MVQDSEMGPLPFQVYSNDFVKLYSEYMLRDDDDDAVVVIVSNL